MKKLGEITTQQIVFLIILIMSFAIILFFIFRLNLGAASNKEICHNSVALFERSKLAGEIDLFGRLNCKTNYDCISRGEKCKDFSADVFSKVLTKEELFKSLANEMSDCWWMFGEGKIDYLGATDFDSQCAICSMVRFGDKISEEYPNGISGEEFYNYLIKEKKDETQTYFQYIYGKENFESFSGQMYKLDSLDFSKKYVILTGQKKSLFSGDSSVYSSLVPLENVSSSKLCSRFDLTKA